ncbi:MAG: hypothetical protein AAF806_19145 [Bacteroidota bacterium]
MNLAIKISIIFNSLLILIFLFTKCNRVEEVDVAEEQMTQQEAILAYLSSCHHNATLEFLGQKQVIDRINERYFVEYEDGTRDTISAFESAFDLAVYRARESWKEQQEIWGQPEFERDYVYGLQVENGVGKYYSGLRVLRYEDRDYDVVYFDDGSTDTLKTFNGEYPKGITFTAFKSISPEIYIEKKE